MCVHAKDEIVSHMRNFMATERTQLFLFTLHIPKKHPTIVRCLIIWLLYIDCES